MMAPEQHLSLAKNTAWTAVGMTIRAGIQALYFVLIARALGAREYGAYVGVVALVAIAAPFASLGSGNLLIKHVARNREAFRRHWGKALVTTLISGGLLLGLLVPGARILLPNTIPLQLIVSVAAADLIFVRLLEVSGQAYQAIQRLDRTAQIQLMLYPLRLVAAVMLVVLATAPTALDWGVLYLLSAMVASCAAVLLVNREMGQPELDLKSVGSELREGIYFSLSLSAQSIYNDIDKVMLTRLATLNVAGVYAAAYRLIDLAFVPVRALVGASYPRFFQHGAFGAQSAKGLARRLSSWGLGYGLFVGAALYLLAPFLPVLLGEEYRESSSAVRWLAVLPLLKGIHYFGANALTGAGHQGVRTAIQLGVVLLNVLLNLWLIPLYSWRGAAVASILADGFLAIGIWTVLWQLGRRDGPHRSQEGVAAVGRLG
jgi:O-antigen/teichoic acid export membrane protein